MKGGQNYGKSLWESKAVILYPLFQLIFLFALATWPFFPWTSFSCVSSRPSLIHTSILPACYKRGTGSSPRIVCQCHKACPLCLLPIWPALAGCSEMPTLITNFTFKKRTQIMPGYLKSASCLLNSDCYASKTGKASALMITSPCFHPVLGGTQIETNDNRQSSVPLSWLIVGNNAIPHWKRNKKALGICCLLCFLLRPPTLWFLKSTITEGVSEALLLQLQNRYYKVPQPALVLNLHDPQLKTHHYAQ